jgi:hypothetical protein
MMALYHNNEGVFTMLFQKYFERIEYYYYLTKARKRLKREEAKPKKDQLLVFPNGIIK